MSRRRWWPVVLAAAGVWVVLATVVRSGSGDDETAPVSSTTWTTRPRASQRPSSTTTAIPGAPLLGRATGWQLVIAAPGGTGRVVDLDTGAVGRFGDLGILDARDDGAIVLTQRQSVVWAPLPFDEATRVLLSVPVGRQAFLVDGDDLAWVVRSPPPVVDLVRLADGSIVDSVDLPPGGEVVASLGSSLVVRAGGDAFIVDPPADIRRIGDGEPVAVLDGHVLVSRCDETLTCDTVAVDPVTNEEAAVSSWPTDVHTIDGSPSAEWLLAWAPAAGQPFLIDAAGSVVELPNDLVGQAAFRSSWTPDGALLVVPVDGTVRLVDPLGASGPEEVVSIPVPGASAGQVSIIGAPQ